MFELNLNQSQLFHAGKIWMSLCQETELPALDRFLSQFFRKNPKYGKRDRQFYSDFFFLIFRKAIWIVTKYFFSKKNLVTSMPEFTCDPIDVWPVLKNIPFRKIAEFTLEKIPAEYLENPFATKVHPAYESYFLKRQKYSFWSEEKSKLFFKFLEKRPPLWLRLNYPEKKSEVLQELKAVGFSFQEKILGDIIALSVSGQKGVYELKSFKQGYFEIQDLASQWIGHQVGAKPGMFLWDACAGGGGKTLLLASLLKNRGVIYASDIREYKLNDTQKRLRKAKFFNVRLIPWDGKNLPEFGLEVQKRGGFHRVLVDAPCTGSGTWRRNPEAQFRFSLKKIHEMTNLQKEILTNASKMVKAGGFLIYATCSWLYEENEAVVFAFLEKNPEFSLKSQGIFGYPEEDSDLMFTAVMEKQK